MVFNATFNNISAKSWRSVVLVKETGEPGENHALSQVTDKLYHIMLYTNFTRGRRGCDRMVVGFTTTY
jgi:hypothetical protein